MKVRFELPLGMLLELSHRRCYEHADETWLSIGCAMKAKNGKNTTSEKQQLANVTQQYRKAMQPWRSSNIYPAHQRRLLKAYERPYEDKRICRHVRISDLGIAPTSMDIFPAFGKATSRAPSRNFLNFLFPSFAIIWSGSF